ncbi:AaceriAGL027Wp [[Ashbya] aceris (nom. inval.)]|nr:AaceriAGL027Wp [[Ashbya] aceris (nom. inval.)]
MEVQDPGRNARGPDGSPAPSYSLKNEKEKSSAQETGSSDVEETALLDDDHLILLMHKMGYKHVDLADIPTSVYYIAARVNELTLEKSLTILKRCAIDHAGDPNITEEEAIDLERFTAGDFDDTDEKEVFKVKVLAALFYYHSPYAEVRSVVGPGDDPSIPVETFRCYVLSTIISIFGCGLTIFFKARYPTIEFSTMAAQFVLFILGTLWSKCVTTRKIPLYPGYGFHLNLPIPWSKKEQMFSTLLYSITTGVFYSYFNIVTQDMFYEDPTSLGFQILLSVSLQFMGFGLAGLLRPFVVFPARALWPLSMPTIALNNTLLAQNNDKGTSIRKIFFYFAIGMYIYNWFPTVFADVLSNFNWLVWIKPNNFNLAAITGGQNGLAVNPLSTFDWNYITHWALALPFYTVFLQYLGSLLAVVIIIALYYTNFMECQYLPIFGQPLYNNEGKIFRATAVLTDFKLDWEKYQNYSLPYYTAGNIVGYGSFIALYTLLAAYSLITEYEILGGACVRLGVGLWSLTKLETWKNVHKNNSSILEGYDDAHCREMRKYPEVPEWWFFVVFLVSLIFAIVLVTTYKTNTPVWGIFLAIGLNVIFLLPLTTLQATTGASIGLNLLVQMITGYLLPGNPYALMIIKAFGYNIDGQADNYLSNLKIAHYCKIPPVPLFRGQLCMVLIQVIVSLAVTNWQIHNVPRFCAPDNPSGFMCPGPRVYYNASIVWGIIGPKKVFSHLYPMMKWCWLIGALLGVFFGSWSRLSRKYKLYYPRSFNPVVFVSGMIELMPPYNLRFYTSRLYVSFIGQYWLRRYHLRIWEKYNYMVAAAFNCGVIFSAITIFFALQYSEITIEWILNTVNLSSMDAVAVPLKNVTLTDRGYFGPERGSLP